MNDRRKAIRKIYMIEVFGDSGVVVRRYARNKRTYDKIMKTYVSDGDFAVGRILWPDEFGYIPSEWVEG